MAACDLNDDCWTQITLHLARTSIGELLKCGTLSRRFQCLVDTNPFWPAVGKRLKVGPPNPHARKYKTWKSLVMQKRGNFCENCPSTHCQKRKLYLFSEPHSVVLFVCTRCCREYQPPELSLFYEAKRKHLARELGKLAIFKGRNIETVIDEIATEVWDSAGKWLHNGTDTNLAAQMALKFSGFVERRAIVKQSFAEEADDRDVRRWMREGEGNIDQIVQALRDRRDRYAHVRQQFRGFAAEDIVRKWAESGDGNIDQIVQIIRTRGDRRTELKNKLAAFGLKLYEKNRACQAYINDAVGDVDQIVTKEREERDAKSLDDFVPPEDEDSDIWPPMPPTSLHPLVNELIDARNKKLVAAQHDADKKAARSKASSKSSRKERTPNAPANHDTTQQS
ncbi:hypothetical protein HK097_010395 [Rhizophlyctis rosea]|uniref:F-box domain-containing protein n=1 Tax=Rhizophlyctis rosea TaxID=64517 RepID=A0AAD5S985_9FUNG|nr:hypothetical protein HK097_010395 [Rhizophlyctis rosea]